MTRERDTQRAKVYRADDSLKPFAMPLPTVRDVERFTAKLFKSERVKAAWPGAIRNWGGVPRVRDGRGCRFASGAIYSITIPLWARSSDVVTHELAHTITSRHYGRTPAAHGWQFCHVYLKLTLYMMGREAHDALKAAMKANRVRFTPPRPRRALSPERRAELVARLARAREARAAAAALPHCSPG